MNSRLYYASDAFENGQTSFSIGDATTSTASAMGDVSCLDTIININKLLFYVCFIYHRKHLANSDFFAFLAEQCCWSGGK